MFEHICLLLIKIFLRYFIYVLYFHKQDICEILIRHLKIWYLKNIIINLKHITKEIYILYFSIFIYIYITMLQNIYNVI